MEECEVRGVTDMTDSQEVKNVSEQQDALELNPLYPEYQAEHHSEYVDALKSAIGSDKKGKLRNIAISGTYGSGKSSILEKVVEDFEGVKPCSTKNISLAPLASCCGNAERRSDNNENRHGSKGPTDDFSTDTPTNRIQREIVKQLLYGVDPKDVPLSRFHRIHEKGKWEKIGFSLMTSVFLTMLLGAFFGDDLRKNPFDFKLSEVLENDTKEKVALTEEQEQSLLSFIKTDNVYHKYFDDVLILLKTGLRISELCGLTIMDVDFNHEVVIIDHQLLKSKEQGYYIETPKTKSGTRQVPLSEETIKAFQRLMKKRPKAEPFVIDGRGNFLFVNQKGKPKVAIDYNALFVRMVKKYNKHHKDNPLPHITPHTLRHTFCTRLASKNMNPKDLQYIMGHSNISITMNWYAHASIDTAKSEVQRLIA